MIEALAIAIGIVAVVVWAFAAWQVIQVVQAVKSGQRMSLFFPGWPWNIEKAVAKYGPQVERPLRRFQLGFLAFFACILVAIAITFVAAAFQNP